jgi:hypothetical protein
MLLTDVESTKEGECGLEGAFVVLKDDLFGEIQVLADDLSSRLLFCFDHKYNYIYLQLIQLLDLDKLSSTRIKDRYILYIFVVY